MHKNLQIFWQVNRQPTTGAVAGEIGVRNLS
jgi:hypothetical protein